jgi:hypothetical protein
MNTVEINDLPPPHAEDLIAILWQALEAGRIGSPELTVSLGGVGVDLRLRFGSRRDADLVMRAVPHVTSSVGSRATAD